MKSSNLYLPSLIFKYIAVLCCLLYFTPSITQTPITTQFTMRDGLSQMKVSDILFDTRGLLWVGTRNGLNKFDGAEFTVYTTVDGLLHNRVHALGELSDGRIVVLNYDGINVFDGSRFTSFPNSFHSVMFQMVVDREDRIWINDSNNGRTLLLDIATGEYKTVWEDSQEKAFMYYDSDIDQKYLYLEQCFYKLDTILHDCIHQIDKRITHSFDLNKRPHYAEHTNSGTRISYLTAAGKETVMTIKLDGTIEEDGPNDIFFAIDNNVLLPSYGRQYGMISSQFIGLNSADYDRIGQIWLGTENGLVEIHKPVFENIPNSKVPYVWSVVEDNEGRVWLGTYGDGLYTYENSEFRKQPGVKPKNFFASAIKDNKGQILFGHAGGILVLTETGFVDKMREPVFAIHFDENRDQYVLGVLGGVKISKTLDSFDLINEQDGLFENNYIQFLHEDSRGNYWLGSYEGLARVNPDTGEIENHTASNGKLTSGGVFCGVQDNEGRMWFGGDPGLLLYDEKSDSLHLVNSTVLNELVKSLIVYDENNLLIGTKSGLFIFNFQLYVKEGLIDLKPLNNSIGYTGIEPGFTGFFRDSRENIWVTSSTSLDILKPKLLNLDNFSLRTNIAKVNDRLVPFEHGEYVFHNRYNDDNVALWVDAIGSVRPQEVMYQYRINGAQWSEWLSENPIQINNLTHGKHRIDVRAGPTDLPVNKDNIDTLDIYIDLPFYKRAFFTPFLVLFVSFLLASLLYYFIKQRRERKALEKSLLDLKYLRNQLLLSELNPHFIFNVLASIQHKVLTGKKEMASEYIVKLSKLIRNYLSAAYKGNNPEPSNQDFEVSLDKEIETLRSYIDFEKDKSGDHFDYIIETDADLDLQNTFIPPMLLQPFVENAIKHGLLLADKKGMLVLKFQYIANSLVCTIQDDGVGLKRSKEINQSRYKTHKSLGSSISVERVAILNSLGYDIEYELRERNEGGTEFILTLKDN